MGRKLFRVIYEVHSIVSANTSLEAESEARRTAKNNKWILKKVIADIPEEDESFSYPAHVIELVEEERRTKKRPT